MKFHVSLTVVGAVVSLASTGFAALTGPVFYGDAPDEHHPWAVHDRNRPQPKVVTPGTFSSQDQPGRPPSDAMVLFDGTDLSHWETDKGQPVKWTVQNGDMQVKPGSGEIRSKEQFGDCQLHIEWAESPDVTGSSQGRGNSGVFLPGGLEIQVLDCYHNLTYADGAAGAYYGVNPPLANALRPPGQFEVYDIVFRRPVYKNGQQLDPGYVTVFMNGVLVQDHTPLEGPGGHMRRSKIGPFPEKGPLHLQDHGNPVRFRNIWCRQLPPRAVEGGTDGYLTQEATTAKRHQIAASVREDAAKLGKEGDSFGQMQRLMESLIYEDDPATFQQVEKMADQYVANLKALPADQLERKKDQVKYLSSNFKYLAQFHAVPATFDPELQLEQMIKAQGWDKKKRR